MSHYYITVGLPSANYGSLYAMSIGLECLRSNSNAYAIRYPMRSTTLPYTWVNCDRGQHDWMYYIPELFIQQ